MPKKIGKKKMVKDNKYGKKIITQMAKDHKYIS